MRILFFGTSDFAVSMLEALVKNGCALAGVVTRPDEPAGRKHTLTPPPVKIAAVRLGIPILQPERLEPDAHPHQMPTADIIVVAAYGKIIPRVMLGMPPHGALNIHPSLLPRWRGPAPIQYALLHGDAETGVTIMAMDEELDHGPIVASVKHPMLDKRYTYPTLHDILARIGAELLIKTLPTWMAGDIIPVPQDESQATFSKMLTREDGRIDWKKSAIDIERMVRAFHSWPSTWTTWTLKGKSLRLRIAEADWTSDMPASSRPGLVWRDGARPLIVAAGCDSLVIKKIGAEGKYLTDAEAFVRGHANIIGAVLG
ncbi:MAG: methionyl-tRNA formyltransferase [Candidatus Sungbacteria bacterium RIFCSPLOWO2_01_FULL_54_21]|uniref:Methionyl-tRNA formyltransferase n=1 Tax=Candidatus Sungbacteria bacterium RIFCSPLOWO2_01_FULL_54_21 TaxID=1802279 RepID=A0A1G2LA15_9BACT|nr:MAG: methionyl-tRNA formyltransferase [Candidatus Sungbacteria bacterium RIFCSPLOWO2_01_FULL_54_21]